MDGEQGHGSGRRKLPGRSGPAPVRFAKAVPLRRDRRALRRAFRSVVREARAEQQRRVTTGLGRLAEGHVAVVKVRTAPGGDEIVEFEDGTRLEVEVRDGELAWHRLIVQRWWGRPYIERIEPCLAYCWFRLHFFVSGAERCTVMVRVDRLERLDRNGQ